ncbi:hypothetical protein [Microbulbifer sp. S227A]|uniref:hypothetical protein n=1 Tax=Microbulbifer sp. S227A TaxID=3415131 RepID=UPI003C7BE377
MQAPDTSPDRAFSRLQTALAALDQAMIELDEVQKKFDSVSSRIDTLLVNTAKSPSANLGANLRSLNARSEVLRKALDRARRNFASARKGYHQASQAYSSKHGQHADALGAARMDIADAERCKGAMSRSLLALFDTLSQGARDKGPGHGGPALDPARFLDLLIVLERTLSLDPDYDDPALRHRPVDFLEIGCGNGQNLALLNICDVLATDRITGIDTDAPLIASAKTAFGLEGQLAVADPMAHDYSGHDVIFCFRPFQNPEQMRQLETRLVASMRQSAYLIAVQPDDLSRFPELECVSGIHGIWKKTGGRNIPD